MQRVGHDRVTELYWKHIKIKLSIWWEHNCIIIEDKTGLKSTFFLLEIVNIRSKDLRIEDDQTHAFLQPSMSEKEKLRLMKGLEGWFPQIIQLPCERRAWQVFSTRGEESQWITGLLRYLYRTRNYQTSKKCFLALLKLWVDERMWPLRVLLLYTLTCYVL